MKSQGTGSVLVRAPLERSERPETGECALLHGGEQRLLLLKPKEVDLVNVEHALVRPMDGAWLNTLVGGRLHAT